MFLQNHFQNAYVARNLDRAMEMCRERYNIPNFGVFDFDSKVRTPGGMRPIKLRAGIAWLDSGVQLEIIEPVSGYVDHYREALPPEGKDAELRFHHMAVRRDDIDQMRAEIAASGLPFVAESNEGFVTFIYVDARKTLGHYLEYVWGGPECWEMQAWPKSRTVVDVPYP